MILRVCSTDNFLSPIYCPWSLKFGACYITVQWVEFRVKNATLCLQKNCFYHFHLYFDKVSNFSNRILTNQKPELVIKNCQWNCMLVSDDIDKRYLTSKLEHLENYYQNGLSYLNGLLVFFHKISEFLNPALICFIISIL